MQPDFNNKRFVPYTDEFRSGNQYGVYDTVNDCKVNTTLDIESATNLAIKFNENLEKIPDGLQVYDPVYGIPYYEQHLPMTGSWDTPVSRSYGPA